MTPKERREAAKRGQERMDAARRAGGDITCRLTVTEIHDTRNVPVAWRGEWVARPSPTPAPAPTP